MEGLLGWNSENGDAEVVKNRDVSASRPRTVRIVYEQNQQVIKMAKDMERLMRVEVVPASGYE